MTFADGADQDAGGTIRIPFKRHRYRPTLSRRQKARRFAAAPAVDLRAARAMIGGCQLSAGAGAMGFDGFISYSHAADGQLAPCVQRGLHLMARPWHRRRALWIFRDQTGLAVTPALWSSIQNALDDSKYFVLLASPEAAGSLWVNREIEHWVNTKSPARILPVVTDGVWQWDAVKHDFSADSTAVPPALRGVFAEEPLYLDLRWARDKTQLTLRHPRFRDAIARLAAPMHGISKDDLEGEDVRQQRRARRLWSSALSMLFILAVAAASMGAVAVRNGDRAAVAGAEMRRQQESAENNRAAAERFAAEARQQQQAAQREGERARRAGIERQRQERLAREQGAVAEQAAAEAAREQQNARRQGQNADRAARRAADFEQISREQKAAAQQSAGETKRMQEILAQQQHNAEVAAETARRQERIAKEQQRLAEDYAAEAERQGQNAREQKQLALEAAVEAERQKRIAVGRQLMNEAKAGANGEPATALRLGLASEGIQSDAESRIGLASLATSTRYAAAVMRDIRLVARGPGDVVATAGADGTVSLWNFRDQAHPRRLSTIPQVGVLYALEFSPDGRTLIAAAGAPDVRRWDVADPAQPVPLAPLAYPIRVYSTAFGPDGQTVVVGSDDGKATVWDVRERDRPVLLSTLSHGPMGVPEVAFSKDGRTVATRYGSTIIWDLTMRTRPFKKYVVEDEGVSRPALHPNGRILALGLSDGTVALWDLLGPRRLTTLKVSDGQVGTVRFNTDGTVLAVGHTRGITLWDVTSPPVPLRKADLLGDHSVASVEFAPDGRSLAGAGKGLTLWTLEGPGEPQLVKVLADNEPPRAVGFAADGRSMAAVHHSGEVGFWDTSRPGRPVPRSAWPSGAPVIAAEFSPESSLAALAGRDQKVRLIDIANPASPTLLGEIDAGAFVNTVSLSSDGRTLAVGTSGAIVTLWDVTDRRRMTRMARLTHGNATLETVRFSPDGRSLAVAVSGSGAVLLWNLSDRTKPVAAASLPGPDNYVTGLAFSSDGKKLVTGSENTVNLWDITDITHASRLATVATPVRSVALSSDDHTLAAVVDTGMVLWDLSDWTKPARLIGFPSNEIRRAVVAFSPDGRTLFTGGSAYAGSRSILWDTAALNDLRANPVKQTCAMAGRGLTVQEWTRYVPEFPYEPSCPGDPPASAGTATGRRVR